MIRISNTQYVHFLQQADYLRRSGLFCDATISVKGQTFRAHRLVLACASRTLARRLAQGDADGPGHCTLECFLPRTFQQVLEFTYAETLEVSAADLRLLLRAAQLLEMQPLEEQCRRQLDALGHREAGGKGEITDLTEESDSAGETDQKPHGEKLPGKEATEHAAMKKLPSPEPCQRRGSPPPLVKKPRLSPVSAATGDGDSVITRSVSLFSLPSPWTLPLWNLRQIADCSRLTAAQPLQSNPFSFSARHIPLMSSSFQSAHSSVLGYAGVHPWYKQNHYPGPATLGGIIKQGPLKRRRNNPTAFTGTGESSELRKFLFHSYAEDAKADARGVTDCQRCRLSVPVLRESASTPPPAACAGCRFCGRGDAVQQEAQSHRQGHRGEKPYQCQRCPKKFSLKHQLDTHHRVHTGEKPFECLLCHQRSRDYSAMIKHLRTHNGAAPYQCTVCQEYCSSLVAMQRHVKSHAVHDFPPDWSINSTYQYISHASTL